MKTIIPNVSFILIDTLNEYSPKNKYAVYV